jgi:uncharacterized protein YjdB
MARGGLPVAADRAGLRKMLWHQQKRLARGAVLTAFGAVLVTPLRAQVIADVQVTPASIKLKAGQETRLFAAAYDPQGRIIAGATITYLTTDSTVAAVGSDGLVTAHQPGLALIEAVAGGRRDTTSVTVEGATPAPEPPAAPAVAVSGIVLEPAALSLLPLEPARLIAHVSTADSSTPPIIPLTWRSGDTHVAAVDRDGVVVGIAPGVTTITASAGNGVTGTVAVAVDTALFATPARLTLAPGATDTLTVTVPSQQNRRLEAGLSWAASDTSVVRVGPLGVVTGVQPGTADVTVRGYGMTGRIPVEVHQPVTSFDIIPAAAAPVEIPIATSRRFDLRALDASGQPVPGIAPVYTVGDSTIVQFSAATGTLVARRVGTTTLTAAVTGFDPVVWTVQVVPVRVVLDQHRMALRVGDRVQLAARLVDPEGAVVPGITSPVSWTSAAPSVATVASGAITATALGHSLIRAATPWGTTDSVEVYVTGDLLLSSDRAARSGLGIYELRLAEPDQFVPILADTSTNLHPAYSPDRTRIAFSSNRAGSFDIWVMDADGGDLVRVTSDSGDQSEPVWTPDGKRIVYTTSVHGRSQIAIVGADGSDPTQLTDTDGGNLAPAVSPDGRLIAFASARDGNYEIYEMDIDGGNVRRITATPQREQAPQFFRNGDLLYASDRPKGGTQIIRQSGATRTVLAETDDAVLALSLSADGRRYVYLAGQVVERGGNRIDYRLVSQRTDAVPEAVTIPLGAGEQVATPSF